MDLVQVKKMLKDGYEQAGFDVIAQPEDGDMHLRLPHPRTVEITLKLTADDIAEYGKLMNQRRRFKVAPNPTSLLARNYREQWLRPLDPHIPEYALRDFSIPGPDSAQVELDLVSPIYSNFFRFDPGYMALCIDRLYAMPDDYREMATVEPLDIRVTFARPLALRISGFHASDLRDAVVRTDALIDDALFTIACAAEIPLMAANEWPAPEYTRTRQLDKLARRQLTAQRPYDGDLVKLYQAGLASPIPAQQFSSFYQVLETFFQDVQNAPVYASLQSIFNHPNFEASDANIKRIVELVQAYDDNRTPAQMLELLIRQYVDSTAIKEQIEQASGSAEETIGSMAQRLAATREAILRSSENALPMRVDDPTLKRDVRLIRFLAEQVILATQG